MISTPTVFRLIAQGCVATLGIESPSPNYAEGVAPIPRTKPKGDGITFGIIVAAFLSWLWRNTFGVQFAFVISDSQGSCATLGYEAKRRWRNNEYDANVAVH
jgi:hypothetical protein